MESLNMWQWGDIITVSLFVVGIILFRSILSLFIKRVFRNKEGVRQALLSLIKWFTYNGILVFLIVYFSDSKWLFYSFFSIGEVNVTLFLILIALLIITLASRLSKILNHYILPFFYERHQLDKGLQFTMERIIHYVIMVIAVFVSLTTVGIDLSALTVFAGVLGVGIGFGMQNIASNFISGLILLFERPIKVGDRVIIDDVIGDVEKISMRATVVRTLENEHIIIPNSYFLEEKVVNRSFSDPRLRLTVPIGVAYGTDVLLVKEILLTIAREARVANSIILDSPEPFVNFTGFGDSSLDFELFIWISNPEEVIRIKSDLNFRIYEQLNHYGVEIPFPQRDLHIKSGYPIQEKED
ncbi:MULTISPECIES: mechanosensitive ion channel family protein [Pontibacillus]|uniref:Mechanosensitive ion channel n=1 Tax=Pontibacillus chungwhensis TaxID=265426 RepID=A0ABY8USN9_9BACI|nr:MULTISPECIES: mechanosensitive ion channel domain-containing protein [Pontibacillus]MCD5323309.1 mechanosensitive ion channel [Pontibacillus sp. HN14]WIF96690.1 mechanosensitive ion channel [Pontibacillus chungwhensis]